MNSRAAAPRLLRRVWIGWGWLMVAAATTAQVPDVIVDDFTSGIAYVETPGGGPVTACQTGTMLGGARCMELETLDPGNERAAVSFDPVYQRLILNVGFTRFRLRLRYGGFGSPLENPGLNLNRSRYALAQAIGVRLEPFESDVPVKLTVRVYSTPTNYWMFETNGLQGTLDPLLVRGDRFAVVGTPQLQDIDVLEYEFETAASADSSFGRLSIPGSPLEVTCERAGNQMMIRFLSVVGCQYRVESSPDLRPGNWQAETAAMPGNGAWLSAAMPIAPLVTHLFYRVVILPLDVKCERAGDKLLIRFLSVVGCQYRVESSADLRPGNWQTETAVLDGNGTWLSAPMPIVPSVPRRFFRVEVLP